MKKSLKTILCTGIAATFLFTTGICTVNYSKKWINNKIQTAITQYEQQDKQQTKQNFNQYEQNDKQWTEQKFGEGISQYDQRNKQWTDKSVDEKISKYGKEDKKITEKTIKEGINQYEQKDKQWAKQTFEAKLSLEQIAKASSSTYLIINWGVFKTSTGELIEGALGTGSGILFKGGYYLTAKHVTDLEIQKEISHPIYGLVILDHFEFSITGERPSESTTKTPVLEKLVTGSTEELDYSLLKLKDPCNMPFYEQGINMPKKIEPGMTTVAIGFPFALGKNIRVGNLSQTESDMGEHNLTYGNDVLPSDSGGPLFVIEDGNVKLTAITIATYQVQMGLGTQFVNLNYGVKISSIVKDMEEQLSSGKLDKQTAEEIKNFLKLNK